MTVILYLSKSILLNKATKKSVFKNVEANLNILRINLYGSFGKIMHRLPLIVHQSFPTTVVNSNSYTFRGRTSNCKPEQSRLILEDANIDGTSLSTREICHTLLTIPFIQSLKLTSVHDITPVLRKICRLFIKPNSILQYIRVHIGV